MPDYFSHLIVAQKIYERLSPQTRAKAEPYSLYLAGSEGGDLFFFYKATPSQANVGRKLHALKTRDVFTKLLQGDFAYCAGFATHYALDSGMHPAVYAFCDKQKGMFVHQSFEKDLGLYISRKFKIRRQLLPRETLLECTFPIYGSAKLLDESLTLSGVERCIKRYYQYTRYLYAHKKNTYKNSYDFDSLSEKLDECVNVGVKAVELLAQGDVSDEVFDKKFLQR